MFWQLRIDGGTSLLSALQVASLVRNISLCYHAGYCHAGVAIPCIEAVKQATTVDSAYCHAGVANA